MTKVFIDASGIVYRKEMAEAVSEIIKRRYIAGVQACGCTEPPLAQVNLMPPPLIETLDLTIYDGQSNNAILITSSDIFGIVNLHVTIIEAAGNVIESGEAVESFEGSGYWGYITAVSVPSGTSVIVHAAATDSLGGVGTRSAGKRVP
jgi:hypothetical protein